jgi:hypothetical protein
MKRYWRILVVVLCAFAGALPANAQNPIAQPASAQESSTRELVIEYIARCLSLGKEVIMEPEATCKPYEQGHKVLDQAAIPLSETGAICQDKDDPRRLSADIIKRIAAQTTYTIAPSGIRILGGVFCGGLDLVGLDLAYSLILDYSLFYGPVNARNFKTTSDLSFDNSLLTGSFTLTRATVGGSIYSSAGLVEAVTVSDTKIGGSWHFNNAIILDDARLSQLSISGDLLLNGSAFSWFWLQSSHVGGALELNDTEARCAYHIKASTVGYITAQEAGFGGIKTTQSTEQTPAIDYSWWRRKIPGGPGKAAVQDLFASAVVKKALDSKSNAIETGKKDKATDPVAIYGCLKDSPTTHLEEPATDLEFLIIDTAVQSSLCVSSFEWPAPKGPEPDESYPPTVVGLRETKVGGSLILRPWTGNSGQAVDIGQPSPNLLSDKRVLEVMGLSAGVFEADFSQDPQSYSKHLDELDFARIENNAATCDQKSEERLGRETIHEGQPSIREALRWLDLKVTDSSQPLTAFINAFEKAGADATDLRVERARLDLQKRTKPFLDSLRGASRTLFANPLLGHSPYDYTLSSSASASTIKTSYTLLGGVIAIAAAVIECGTIAFQWVLWGLADSGLRPAKVIWPILFVLGAFWIWCWFKLRIVGFEAVESEKQSSHIDGNHKSGPPHSELPESPAKPSGSPTKPDIWPITFLFLFDHLIPAYHIREQHYSFSNVYLRRRPKRREVDPLSSNKIVAASGGADPSATAKSDAFYDMSYLWRNYQVRPGNRSDYERLERSLVVLRLIGIVLSAFLLAAVNALISK